MSTSPVRFGTVISFTHTGHVLAVVTSGDAELTLDALTGATDDAPGFLPVRIPGESDAVDVPAGQLTATRVPVGDDVLDRPQAFVLGGGIQPLQEVGDPDFSASAQPTATAGAKVVAIWQTPDGPVDVDTTMASSSPALPAKPPDATHRVIAVAGQKLFISTV